jgi:steroid delta-isomerase-like uncharacterized protein
MGVRENIELAKLHVEECWNKGNIDLIDEIYSQDFELRSLWPNPALPGRKGNRDGAKVALQRWLGSFPDMHFSMDHIVADEEKVITVHTCTATDSGGFMGRAPSNANFAINGILIHQISDGKITRIWTMFDMLGLLQAIGVAPKPPEEPPGEASPGDLKV